MKLASRGRLCVILMLLTWQSPCTAEELDAVAPPELPDIDHVRPTLKRSPVSDVQLGPLSIKFETTTLDDVLQAAGAGEINHRGDAGDSQYWICYSLPSGRGSARIWFSSGELGGPDNTIDSFYAVISDEVEPSASCPELPARLRPVSLSHGLQLGPGSDLLEKRAGRPSATIEDWRLYSYAGKTSELRTDPATGESTRIEFDRLGILGVRIRDGKIAGFFESQATTD